MFTVSFVKAHGSERAKGGRFIIGGLDHENMQGNVTWIASTSNLFWGFEFDKGAMKYGNIDIWPADQLRRVSQYHPYYSTILHFARKLKYPLFTFSH